MASSSSPQARYRPGDDVRVRADYPDHHFRTPAYVQGKSGRVDALCGVFPNPESLAHGGDGLPRQPLYRVAFDQKHLWADRYTGPAGDTLLVDIYEHWLEPAGE